MAEEWEYYVRASESYLRTYELNKHGDKGWELVSHVLEPGRIHGSGTLLGSGISQSDHLHIYTFKRPRKQEG